MTDCKRICQACGKVIGEGCGNPEQCVTEMIFGHHAQARLLSASETMLSFIEAGHAGAGHALDSVYVELRDVVNEIRGRHYGATVPKDEAKG